MKTMAENPRFLLLTTSFVNKQLPGQGLALLISWQRYWISLKSNVLLCEVGTKGISRTIEYLTTDGQKSEVMNMINDKPYTVRYSDDKNPFEVGAIVFGSLVPWNGEWYWSGTATSYSVTLQKKLSRN